MLTITQKISIVALSCTLAFAGNAKSSENSEVLPYLNDELTFNERVDDLVKRMTLKEKISQMFDKAPAIPHLGVPQYNWWNEALHGVARAGKSTVFPQAIGLAATFDETLIKSIATTISDEGRAKHHAFLNDGNYSMYTGLTYWSPNINIFRDPRWGRGQETYGEDPYLTSRIAINFVNGLQGDDDKYLKSVATIKHFAVHSGPEYSRHSDDYYASPKDLNETYLTAFKATIAETDVASIMCAYNRVNGEPACGSEMLIQEQLRDKFKFNGYVVSDCGAIADFYDPNSHHVVDTEAEAAAKAVLTGTDINCGDHHGNTFSYLNEAVEKGLISEAKIDTAVKRLFLARFKLGMFDDASEVPYTNKPLDIVGSKKHLLLSQKAAEKSLVLLKNNGVLPLSKNKKVALIGPNADNAAILIGNYHGKPVSPVTPKQALELRLGKNNVNYAPGSSITGKIFTHYEPVKADNFFHYDYNGKKQLGLKGSYFKASHFDLQPAFKRIDNNIDFQFTESPVDGKNINEFSIMWEGVFQPKSSGLYQFQTKNLSFTLDGTDVDKPIKLFSNKEYKLSAKATINHFWHSNVIEPEVSLSWLNLERNLKQEAINAANQADVIVFVGGITANLEGEEMPLKIDGFSHGDRTHIDLPVSQESLLKDLHKLNKPIVYVNMSGSAIALNWQDKNLDAIIQGFYPGEQTGKALSGLLFGDYSPSGRLPVTFYKSINDLPDFKDYSMDNRTYKYYEGDVLYPFGFGLNYANVIYKNLSIIESKDGGLSITAELSNQSQRLTDEVVQLYISMPDSPVKTPIRQLAGFKKLILKENETKTVSFTLSAEQLSYVNDEGEVTPYKGNLKLSVGAGQGIKIKTSSIVKGTHYLR